MGIGDKNEALEAATTLGGLQEYQIDFEYEGRRGTFVFRRPTLKTRLSIGVMEANLLAGAPRASTALETLNISRLLSTFQHVIVESPDWFDLDTVDDYGLLESLYEKYIEVVKPFRSRRSESARQD